MLLNITAPDSQAFSPNLRLTASISLILGTMDSQSITLQDLLVLQVPDSILWDLSSSVI